MTSSTIGWVPVEGSGKLPLVVGTAPERILEPAVAEYHWLVYVLIILVIIAIIGGVGVNEALNQSSYTSDDAEYWAWWICYGCFCCIFILIVWAAITIIFVFTLPVEEDYSVEDVQEDGGSHDDSHT
jgi:O-antigen/teichoic acid export membrane protein